MGDEMGSATATSNPLSQQDNAATMSTSQEQTISYSAERIIGNGSFGVVFQAAVVETGEIVAIKKVLQDKRFKNRELQIMRQLVKDPHSNIVALKHCFYSQVSLPPFIPNGLYFIILEQKTNWTYDFYDFHNVVVR